MAITLVQQATVGTGIGLSGSVSFGSTTLLGSLLILVVADQGGFLSPTVTGGGGYVSPGGASVSGGTWYGAAKVYYTVCTSGTTSINFDNSAQGAGIGVAFGYEFTGVQTPLGSVYDTSKSASSTGGACSTTITTAGANELLFEIHVVGGSKPAGFTSLDSANGSGYGGSVTLTSSYLVPAPTGSNSISWGSGGIGGFVTAFNPQASTVTPSWMMTGMGQ